MSVKQSYQTVNLSWRNTLNKQVLLDVINVKSLNRKFS